MEGPRDAPFPRVPAIGPAWLFAWAALPLLALMGYAWHWTRAVALALALAVELRWGERFRQPALITLVASSVAVDAVGTAWAWPAAVVKHVILALCFAAGVGAHGAIRARRLDEGGWASEDPRAQPRRAAEVFGVVALCGGFWAVFADEPVLAWIVAHVVASLVAWARAVACERAVVRRIEAVLAGNDPAFECDPRGAADEGVMAVVPRGDATGYRESARSRAEAVVPVAPGEGGWSVVDLTPMQFTPRTVGGLLTALAVATLCSHGYVGERRPWSESQSRLFVAQRTPPPAVCERVSRSMTRLRALAISGATVWQECNWPTCRGAVVVSDDATGRVLDAPEFMRRVRDRDPVTLAQTRLRLTARFADYEVRRVIACDELLGATATHPQQPGRVVEFVINLRDGEIVDDAFSTATCDVVRASTMLPRQRADR